LPSPHQCFTKSSQPQCHHLDAARTAKLFAISFLITTVGLPIAAYADENSPQSAVTYHGDVKAILEAHCVQCHRPNQIAPMSLRTYREVRPWAKAIKKAVESGGMPPFHAAGPIGFFRNDPRLSEEEIATISTWVDASAPQGQKQSSINTRNWSDSKWTMGEPDIITNLPEYQLTEIDKDYNICMYSEHVFRDDTWIRAIDILPQEANSIHHAAIFIVDNEIEIPESLLADEPNFNIIEYLWRTWTPGFMPALPPDDCAVLVPKGSRIGAAVHFAPTHQQKMVQPAIGIYLANGQIQKTIDHLDFLITDGLVIEPGVSQFTLSVSETIDRDISVTGFWVHMHYRGKSAKFIFHYPDDTQETALHIPQYSFDWQRLYHLASPIRLPKGTRVECVNTWDNSDKNPFNPDPTVRVHWGVRSEDEMGGGMLVYVEDIAPSAPIHVLKGIEHSPTIPAR